MANSTNVPFSSIGASPKIEKRFVGHSIALSPVTPIIAEGGVVSGEKRYDGTRNSQDFIYLSNYEIQEVIGQIPIAFDYNTLSFSPGGKFLFAISLRKKLLVYAEPWGTSPIVQTSALDDAFHGAWLDDETVLIAGTDSNKEFQIGLLHVGSEHLEILYQEGPTPSQEFNQAEIIKPSYDYVDGAFCSPLGLVVSSIGFGRYVATFQLTEDRKTVLSKARFPVEFDGLGLDVSLSDDGQTILCTNNSILLPGDRVGLFDHQGKLLDALSLPESTILCRHGVVLSKNSKKNTLAIHQIRNNTFQFLQSNTIANSDSLLWHGLGLVIKDGKIIFGVEAHDHTDVYELQDYDVLQLSSENPNLRRDAALSIGQRQFKPAVPVLIRLLRDQPQDVQNAALQALRQLADPAALGELIRAIGSRPGDLIRSKSLFVPLSASFSNFLARRADPFLNDLLSAIEHFPPEEVTKAIFDCLDKSTIVYRRGAVRALEYIPAIEATDKLCQVLSDEAEDIRQSAVRALGIRKDIRACVALLGRLNDDSQVVKWTTQEALGTILEANGLLSTAIKEHLSETMDVVSYADQVITMGRMQHFESFGNPGVGTFLSSLASACVNSNRPLPDILNSIEALTYPTEHISERVSVSIALTIALICADAMRINQQWTAASAIYRQVVTLSEQAEAPQIEWRAWKARGECWERLGNDAHAFADYRNALGVIDSVWFSLLEEDKRSSFFQDKAILYDQAGVCALRLGYETVALEINEKAKTRYLGDLIARRQMASPTVLDRELKEFWKELDNARPMRVSLAGIQRPGSEPMEIVEVQLDTVEAGSASVMPEKLMALKTVSRPSENLRHWLRMVESVWEAVSIVASGDENHTDYNEAIRQHLEAIYESLSSVQDAVTNENLPLAAAKRDRVIEQYNKAAEALLAIYRTITDSDNSAGSPEDGAMTAQLQENKIWVFYEYKAWIEEIANLAIPDENVLVLEAVMEALNMVLRHKPIRAVPAASAEENSPVKEKTKGFVFVARSLGKSTNSSSTSTRIIDSALERQTQTRWRYVTQLARGETTNYQAIAKTLKSQVKAVQLQFAVTEDGTAAYITHTTDAIHRDQTMPHLKGEDGLQVFTFPELTLSSLNQRLTENDDSWFKRYESRSKPSQPNGIALWQETMDELLQWLYIQLIEPLDTYFKKLGVTHLRIIPHRGLHLIPFSALYRKTRSGKRHYLIDDYVIEYAPSATIQQICRERAERQPQGQSLTAISNPTNDLPFASAEVDQITTYFSDADVNVLPGADARLEKFRNTTPGSILHFSGHGRYNWDDPLSSHLSFAGGDQCRLADLFAETIRLSNTRLVVLSACETNITNPNDLADEYLGLASGFLFAGTPSVISSLWAVDDISSSLLMGHFYQQHLQKGLPPSEALRAAQRWLCQAVDRPYVIQQINLMVSNLEKQRSEVSRWSEEEESINRQIRRLNGRCDELLAEEKAYPGGLPFSHPYYWAAFTVSGVDLNK